MEEAERQGLAFDEAVRAEIAASADPLGPLDGSTRQGWRPPLRDLLRLRPVDRDGLDQPHELSREAVLRWRSGPDYRPRPLSALRAVLDGENPVGAEVQAPAGESRKARR